MKNLLLAFVLLTHTASHAGLTKVNLTNYLKADSPKEFLKNEKPPKKFPFNKMYEVKKAFYRGHFKTCLYVLTQNAKALTSIKDWVTNQKLECGLEVNLNTKKNQDLVGSVFKSIKLDQIKVSSPANELIVKNYILLGLKYYAKIYKKNRKSSWEIYTLLDKYKMKMSSEQLGELYQIAGDVAFLQQRVSLAKQFFFRSLTYNSSEIVSQRLRALDPTLVPQEVTSPDAFDLALIKVLPDSEKRLIIRMKNALQSGDLLNVVTDGVEYLNSYPSTHYAKWVQKQLISIFIKLARANDKKYESVKSEVRLKLGELGGERLFAFSKRAFYYGYYEDSGWAGEVAYEKMAKSPEASDVLKLWVRSLQFLGKYDEALKHLQKVYEISTGKENAVEALFFSGLLSMRKKKYSDAISYFEKLLSLPEKYDRELPSMYWLWRSKQKLNVPAAQDVAKTLSTLYPATYYGLRARAELNGNKLTLPVDGTKKRKSYMYLSTVEQELLKKYNFLVDGGWYHEASLEMDQMPEAKDPDDAFIYAKLKARAFAFKEATIVSYAQFNMDPSLISKSTLKTIYPFVYMSEIETYAKKYDIPTELILGLMRQESQFDATAVSPSNAVGLMQMVRITANEVATDLKQKNFTFPEDLKRPDVNIKFGTYYLRKMLRANKGYVPLALASYNVGIGRMYRWIKSRKDLADLRQTDTSDPDIELWIDELPWDETRLYVHSVMRNYMIYQLLGSDEVKLSDPIWK